MSAPASFLSFLAEQPEHTRALMRDVWNSALSVALQTVYQQRPCICLDIVRQVAEALEDLKV